jgi:hypothetical protein
MRILIGLFLFGAIGGNLYNSFHAFSGTIPVTPEHINPLLDWTSYLLFGFAGVAIGLVTIVFDKILRKEAPPVNWPAALGAVALLGVFYFVSACMFLSNTVILLILIFGFALSWWLYDRSWYALVAALLVALGGTAIEITLVHFNVYYYSRPQFMGVAYWLPFLYCIASVATGQLARALAAKKQTQTNC